MLPQVAAAAEGNDPTGKKRGQAERLPAKDGVHVTRMACGVRKVKKTAMTLVTAAPKRRGAGAFGVAQEQAQPPEWVSVS
jgi:hypothetical protein